MTTESQRWQKALDSADVDERVLAAQSLSYLGAEAACAAVELVRACGDELAVREWAVAALEELPAPGVEFKESLAALSLSAQPLVAYWAVTLLGRMGPAAYSELQPLISLVRDPATDLAVREKAVWTLTQMERLSQDAIPALNALLDSKHPRLARLAERALTLLEKQTAENAQT